MESAIFVSVFVFVFVTLIVAGSRALAIIEAHKAKAEADRRLRAIRKTGRTEYTGALYSRFGNVIED